MGDGTSEKTCESCGAKEASGVTDKLKFKTKKKGTVYVQHKADGKSSHICRKCWQKNLRHFHDKVEKKIKSA